MCLSSSRKTLVRSCLWAVCLTTLVTASVVAGPFSVSPIRIELGETERDAVFTIRNQGDGQLDIQLRLVAWGQDEAGNDVYSETDDVLVFPLITQIPAGEERFVRVTHRLRDGFEAERTYRLFAEELVSQAALEDPLTFALQVSVPVLIGTPSPSPSFSVTDVDHVGGTVRVSVRNDGNRHGRVGAISVRGTDAAGNTVLEAQGSGWYVLRGAQRSFSVALPPDLCEAATSFEVTLEEETTGEHMGSVDAAAAGCEYPESEQEMRP